MKDEVLLFLNGHLGRPGDYNDAYNKCSAFAYRDMCRTIRFIDDFREDNKSKEKQTEIRDQKNSLRDEITKKIQTKVEQWLVNIDLDAGSFDKDYIGLCENIMNCFKGMVNQNNADGINDRLSFGQAQKWVNMTLKNLYVYDNSNHSGMGIEKLLPYIHIPIDNYIIDIVSDKRRCWVDDENIKYSIKSNGISWSRWDKKQYLAYRKSLSEAVKKHYPDDYPIQWELKHWSTIE